MQLIKLLKLYGSSAILKCRLYLVRFRKQVVLWKGGWLLMQRGHPNYLKNLLAILNDLKKLEELHQRALPAAPDDTSAAKFFLIIQRLRQAHKAIEQLIDAMCRK